VSNILKHRGNAKQDLIIAEKRFLRKYGNIETQEWIHDATTILVVKVHAAELLAHVSDHGLRIEYLAVEVRQHFSHENTVSEVATFEVVEEKEEFLLVLGEKGEAESGFQGG